MLGGHAMSPHHRNWGCSDSGHAPWPSQGFFKKQPFEDNIDFGLDFGANLPPCWPPKSKIFRNSALPRSLRNFIVFCIDFLLILTPFWPPTWVHLGSQDDSKFEKLALKLSRVAPKPGGCSARVAHPERF